MQSDDIEIDTPTDNEIEIEIITEEEKIVDDVNIDETSSEIKNWSSLLNDDLNTIIPEYDCVSTTKEKEQNESEVKLELEGNYYSNIKCINSSELYIMFLYLQLL